MCLCSESELGWENDIREDVLEECSQSGAVLHIHVDKHSQGNVYVKCSTPQVASAAFNKLNGRFFAGQYYAACTCPARVYSYHTFSPAGKQIVVQYVPEAAYHIKFPETQAAITPLK